MIRRAPRGAPGFVMVRNSTARDSRLSFRARGLLTFILSQPDDWTCESDELAEHGTEGRDAVRTALKELETAGYLTRRKYQDDRGHWRTESTVNELPTTGNTSSARAARTRKRAAHTGDGKPVVGGPVTNKKTSLEEHEEQPRAHDQSVSDDRPPQLQLVADPGDVVIEDEFEAWWSAYADGRRKIGKRDARKAFERAAKRAGGLTKFLDALVPGTTRWNAYWSREKHEARHIPHPTTWLNRDDWESLPPTPEPTRRRA